jgi:uncharacterized protein YdhG (YjbR/CyaY superfamily)
MSEKDVDAYLGRLPDNQRTVLEKLRQTIKSLSPEITELISYDIPSFKYKGRQFVAFAAYPTHCNFLLMSYPLMETFKAELKRFETDKATIRFAYDKPMSVSQVKKLVKARMVEIDDRLSPKKHPKKKRP